MYTLLVDFYNMQMFFFALSRHTVSIMALFLGRGVTRADTKKSRQMTTTVTLIILLFIIIRLMLNNCMSN